MTKIINYLGEDTEISDYLPEHHPANQRCEVVKGVFINPNLRNDFDSTPNEERDDLETEHWYGRPYIVTDDGYSESYSEFVARMTRYNSDYVPESESEFNERKRKLDESWLQAYPTGIRYEVRCLTGGSWDRSSSQGMFPSLKEAIDCATSDIVLYGYM
ncbi:conserved hypothetical protein [Vibrio nigripulchritudo SOn1]|uniref:Phage protein n=1 Tax=Vibrio nigripulchritudo SOn1 TaxID=1238450 RepID=A0AAV2VUM8_9VIBR|nr:hypothetical protein [Vibrio nigripulchritudo]CCO48443.1 conserved hypothetical protein [Vibrio nigripulchritudo SOn1]